MHSRVIDTAVDMHSGVIDTTDTAVTKIGDFLYEFEAIFKKDLTRVSGA
jgi:hypothetical protein